MARRGKGHASQSDNSGERQRHERGGRKSLQHVDPEIKFASYQLSDTQKKRIVYYLTRSALMFLLKQLEVPSPVKEHDARSMILTDWWNSLCTNRVTQGLNIDVNESALMYRSYWFGFTEGCSQSPFVDVACKVCDPAAELSEGWLETCAEELQEVSDHYTPDMIKTMRDQVVEKSQQTTAKEETDKQVATPEPEGGKTESRFAPGESWADRMEMEE